MATDRVITVHENGRIATRGLFVVRGHAQGWQEADDVLDYTIDWRDWLGSDTISSSTFTDEGNGTLTGAANTTTETSVNVSLSDGEAAEVTNTIVTAGGLTKSLRFYLKARRNDRLEDYGLR